MLRPKQSRSVAAGLERSCQEHAGGFIAEASSFGGIELFRAWFAGEAYRRHRHDTYAIGVTESGVQSFEYRGAAHASTPGDVVALYPDEVHDGRAGTEQGFGYRIVYVEPALLVEAVRAVHGGPRPLPFVSAPVSRNATLSSAVRGAFPSPLDSLAADSLLLDLARGLLAAERRPSPPPRRVDVQAVERARRFLDAARTRPVHSTELESITGLSRFDLCRQFRIWLGTSPHRYLMMRRLAFARERIDRRLPLSQIAYEVGFADQAHFTRAFKSAFGLTPARYRALKNGTADPTGPIG